MENEAKTTCQACGQNLSYDKEHDGETVDCPTCGKPVILTAPQEPEKSQRQRQKEAIALICYGFLIGVSVPTVGLLLKFYVFGTAGTENIAIEDMIKFVSWVGSIMLLVGLCKAGASLKKKP